MQVLTVAVKAQTEALTAVLEKSMAPKPQTLSSTIRINPLVKWPMLKDDGPDSREIDDFFDKFDEIAQLANDGRGMADLERLQVLKNCLEGSRASVYKVIMKKHKNDDLAKTDPGAV